MMFNDTVILLISGAIAVVAVIAAIRTVLIDGHHRIPTRAGR